MSRTILCAFAAAIWALLVPPAFAADSDLSVNARLLLAARNSDSPALDRALDGGASPNARNRLGETALLIALKKDDVTMARRMLAAGTDVNIAALNGAIEGLPADRMRLHICWGNYEGPHTHDLPLLKIIDLAFKARPQAIRSSMGSSLIGVSAISSDIRWKPWMNSSSRTPSLPPKRE